MVKVELGSSKDSKAIQTAESPNGENVLVTVGYGKAYGTFKAVYRDSAGTSVLASVDGSDALCLTDLIITSDKVNGATITVQFTDGVNTVIVALATVTDAPCNLAIGFAGNWTGWQGARIDVVTVGTVKANVSCGYYKIMKNYALEYSEWNARR